MVGFSSEKVEAKSQCNDIFKSATRTSYLLEWLSQKKQEMTRVGKDIEKREPSYTDK